MTEFVECSACGQRAVDLAAISYGEREWGFCSLACMLRFVHEMWPAVARA